jgi:hypothetical protein
MNFPKHHLLLYVLDPHNCLFDLVQRFTVFCGYYNRSDCTFTRPKDDCNELQETHDQDGDDLSEACKTDGEHTLGYRFHCLWGLWKSHLAVNKQLHHIRERAGYWLHPYIEEAYAEVQEDRAYPSSCQKLPETLARLGSQQMAWKVRFSELKAFKKERGHLDVPRQSILGRWVNKQRFQYGKKEREEASSMTDDHMSELSSLGFKWRKNLPWKVRFSELIAFKKERGHLDVPLESILGRWVQKQRTEYRKKEQGENSHMTDERKSELESLGFEWSKQLTWKIEFFRALQPPAKSTGTSMF